MQLRRFAAPLVLAAVLHTSVVGGRDIYKARPAARAWATMKEGYETVERKLELHRERARLVAEARRQIREGRFRLGEFLIKKDDIETRAEGGSLDIVGVREKYHVNLERLSLIHI